LSLKKKKGKGKGRKTEKKGQNGKPVPGKRSYIGLGYKCAVECNKTK